MLSRSVPIALAAISLVAVTGRAPLQAAEAAPIDPPPVQSGEDLRPQYKPPLRGAPRGRITGASRGSGSDFLWLDVLAPDHVALTSQEQPTLYWFLSSPVQQTVVVTVIAVGDEKPLLEAELSRPLPAGIDGFALRDTAVMLRLDTEYEWSVAIISDPAARSTDILAGGIVKRVAALPGDANRGALARPTEAAKLYAETGYWYDAVDVLSKAIAAAPRARALRQARSALLEQVGLSAAAAHDRQAAP